MVSYKFNLLRIVLRILLVTTIIYSGKISAQINSEFYNPCSHCQSKLRKQKKGLIRQFKKLPCYDNTKDYVVIDFVKVEYDKLFVKEDFVNYSFLNDLAPYFDQIGKFPKKKFVNSTFSFICDSNGYLMASACGFEILCCLNQFDSLYSTQKLVDLIFDHEISCVFELRHSFTGYYFALCKDNIYVIRYEHGNYNLHSIEELTEKYWDEFSLFNRRRYNNE